jgi:hypothetical protein
MYDLKSCPLCGGTNLLLGRDVISLLPLFAVQCQNIDCGCEGGYDLGESGAVEKWNTRPGEDALVKEVERLILFDRNNEAAIDMYLSQLEQKEAEIERLIVKIKSAKGKITDGWNGTAIDLLDDAMKGG